jgi:FKBP-type peptidyl-prolyl cis-trans isomerase SlyD
MIQNGDLVTFRYSITDEHGALIDTSGDEPVSHICGAHTLVPGLERALVGHLAGERFQVKVPPAYAYGERITDEHRLTLPRTDLPGDMPLELGMIVMLEDDAGEPMPLWLVGLTDDSATFDANHPLAGVTLTFDVELVSVRAATVDEKHRNLMGVAL